MRYQSGFGNTFSTEAEKGALPVGQNSPQKTPQRPVRRAALRHRVHRAARREPVAPGSTAAPLARCTRLTSASATACLRSGPFDEVETPPNRCAGIRCRCPPKPTDFVDGLVHDRRLNGDADAQTGIAVHLYRANRSMENRCFVNADGEMLIVPQQGALLLATELGRARGGARRDRGDAARREVPRRRSTAPTRGYVCENYGAPFRLPELGPDRLQRPGQRARLPRAGGRLRGHDGGKCELVAKFGGALWARDHGALAARRRRLARQLRAVQVRPRALHGDRLDQLRPSRPVDLHRADLALATRRAPPTATS